jgi:surface antigen
LNLGRCNRKAVGALLGAGAGAAAGSSVGQGDGRVVATIGGAMLGVLAGSAIGRKMDQADGYCVAQTLAHVEDGETVIWRNADTDSEYHVTPERSYSNEAGEYCRDYTAAATIGQRNETVRGSACLQADGTWKLVG